jgi:tRNA U34 2-thiouridine synthase MnmA/TrmU
VKEWHFLSDTLEFPLKAKAKIRYRQDEQDCTISSLQIGEGAEVMYIVKFNTPQRAITS